MKGPSIFQLFSLLDWMSQQSHSGAGVSGSPRELSFSVYVAIQRVGSNSGEGMPQEEDGCTCRFE